MMIHDAEFRDSGPAVLARIRERQYRGVLVKFLDMPVVDEAASRERGTPIYATVPMVNIKQSGDRHSNFFAPAETPFLNVPELGRHVTYSEFFSAEWEAYCRQQAVAVVGAPVENLPGVTAGQVATLKAINILTLEQLVEVNPKALKPLGLAGQALQERAREYLARAQGHAGETALAEEVAQLRAALAALTNAAAGGGGPEPEAGDDRFADWSAEKLREFLVANGEPKPRSDCSLDVLRKRAAAIDAQVTAS